MASTIDVIEAAGRLAQQQRAIEGQRVGRATAVTLGGHHGHDRQLAQREAHVIPGAVGDPRPPDLEQQRRAGLGVAQAVDLRRGVVLGARAHR